MDRKLFPFSEALDNILIILNKGSVEKLLSSDIKTVSVSDMINHIVFQFLHCISMNLACKK